VVLSLILLIFICALFVFIAKKIKIPAVVALILAGFFVSLPYFRNILIGSNSDFIFTLGDVGLISLMFLAGLEVSWKELYKEKKDAFYIAIITSVVSFIIGFLAFFLLGFSLIVSLVIGIAMSVTAEATRAKVLLDLKVLKTRVGSALMGVGIIDDLFGLGLFLILVLILKTSFLRNDLMIVGAIVAFFIGIITSHFFARNHSLIDRLEKALVWIVIPFFFISIGLNFDFSLFVLNPLLLIGMLVLGFSVKFIGVFASRRFVSFSKKQLLLISWAMNSRGAIELALALIAFKALLIPKDIYSSIIVMALVTTAVFPFIITHMIKKDKRIMN